MVCVPPYEKLASAFRDAFQYHTLQRARSKGIISEIKSTTIHEGRSMRSVDEEGQVQDTEMIPIVTELQMSFEEMEKVSIADIDRLSRQMADTLNQEQSRHAFKLFEEATEKTGQKINARGKPLDHDTMLEAIRMMPASFDPLTGKSNIAIVVSPGMKERLQALEQEYQSSSDLKKELAKVEAEKRDEYRTDEMARVLVG